MLLIVFRRTLYIIFAFKFVHVSFVHLLPSGEIFKNLRAEIFVEIKEIGNEKLKIKSEKIEIFGAI